LSKTARKQVRKTAARKPAATRSAPAARKAPVKSAHARNPRGALARAKAPPRHKPAASSRPAARPVAGKTAVTRPAAPARVAAKPTAGTKPGVPLKVAAAPAAVDPKLNSVAPGRKAGKSAKAGAEKLEIRLPPTTPEDRQSQLKLLIARGKEQGFLTYAEVNDHLPSEIVDPEQIEDIVQMINDMGIPVYEKAPDAEALLLREPVVADDEAAEEAAAALATTRLLRLADGPDEVHRNQIGRLELGKYDEAS